MELTIVALALFIGLIACWLMLPDSADQRVAHQEAEPLSHIAVEQLA